MTAAAFTISAAALAIAAWVLSRIRPRLRAAAWALTAVVLVDVARIALDAVLAGAATPYQGAARLAFTAHVVLFCLWPAPFVALAWHVLPRRRWWPPVAIFGALGVLLALAYPTLHGPAMIAAQGLTRPLALLMVCEALLIVRPRLHPIVALGAIMRSRTGAGVVVAFAIDMLAQSLGTWIQPWPWVPDWRTAMVVTAAAHVGIAAALAWEARRGKRGIIRQGV